jgi:SAM-dependent methyltransferase
MNLQVRDILRALTPDFIRSWRARRLRARTQLHFKGLTNRETFSQIYSKKMWGGPEGEFFSGSGSDSAFADVYVSAVREFLQQTGARRIVDLGCGDFRIGNRIREGYEYTGVDVVPELVAAHDERFSNAHTSFQCLDITADPLPLGDVCLIRQVLQHLSNDEIARVLASASAYPFLVITEHFPAASRFTVPNLDKPHGPDIRTVDGSAVCIDAPPFNGVVDRVLCEVEVPSDRSVIRTVVIDQTR